MANVATPITYDVPSSFTYDISKIQVQNNVASLAGTGPYDTTNPFLLSLAELDMSALAGFTEVASVSGSDATSYVLNINGTDYYWNGSAWVASNGTYSQSNPAATINTNSAHSSMNALLIAGAKVFVKSFLHSATGSTTPTITSINVIYTFFPFAPTTPPLTTVFLWLTDILDDVIGSNVVATFSATNKTGYNYGKYVVLPFNKTVQFNSLGYAAISIMETSSVGIGITFNVSYQDGKTIRQIDFNVCTVPNAGAIALNRITTVKGTNAINSSSVSSAQVATSGNETQENILNNQAATSLVNIQLDPSLWRSQVYAYTIRRYDGTNWFRETGILVCEFNDSSSTWRITALGYSGPSGPTTGVTWSATTGAAPNYYGQATYKSDNMSGSPYAGTIRYQLLSQSLKEQ